ncbi:MAG TPA: GNAT family N-acetyltransferase [Streptosporangiaceae bacterium]
MERTQTGAGAASRAPADGDGAGRDLAGGAQAELYQTAPDRTGLDQTGAGSMAVADVADVRLRLGGAQDAATIRDFVIGLSSRSRFQRFFASVSPPSSSLLRGLCGGGGAEVLLATHQDEVVGHCMAADRTEGDGARVSEVGLVVTDCWQDRGIGTALLDLAVRRAAGRGAQQLVMDVMPDNSRMRAIIEHRWPAARREVHSDAVTFRAQLADASCEPGAEHRSADLVAGLAGAAAAGR